MVWPWKSGRVSSAYAPLILFLLLGCLLVPSFRTLPNLGNVLRQASPLAILAAGQTFVILSGNIDLSIGALVGLVACVSNVVMNGRPEAALPAAGLALTIGLAVGAFQGLIISRVRIHPFVLTFGMMSILQGIILVFTNYQTVGAVSPQMAWLAKGSVGPLPAPAMLAAAVILAGHLPLRETTFGRYVYAVGGNAEYARRSGVNAGAVFFWVYVVSGLTAALAGLVVAGRLGAGYPLAGTGYDLDALVAVVLGGTSLAGGLGGIGGSVAGVLLLSVISNLLNLAGVTSFVQQVIKGLIIVAAVAVYTRTSQRQGGEAR